MRRLYHPCENQLIKANGKIKQLTKLKHFCGSFSRQNRTKLKHFCGSFSRQNRSSSGYHLQVV